MDTLGVSGPHVVWKLRIGAQLEEQRACLKEARKLEQEMVVKWGGIGGEIGQTASRISAWKKKYGEQAYSVALRIKTAFDPNNILNPGNLEGEGYED